MATLTIDNGIYERLVKKAEERQTSVDALVSPVLEQLATSGPSIGAESDLTRRTKQLAAIQSFTSGMSKWTEKNVPQDHIVDDSRESIYGDRGL